MMKHLILLLIMVLLCGCDKKETPEESTKRIIFMKDPTSGYCFAILQNRTYNKFYVTSLTHMPKEACGVK